MAHARRVTKPRPPAGLAPSWIWAAGKSAPCSSRPESPLPINRLSRGGKVAKWKNHGKYKIRYQGLSYQTRVSGGGGIRIRFRRTVNPAYIRRV